ncbi:XdhC family protein [Alcaligenaceae bacterium]|nr:XdhC family protein [Alcaligenaceae bacterium]
MDSIDSIVLRTLCKWRQENRNAALVTVVRTWGSSPRPVGSLMAMRDDGAVVGSVSGGCIEDDIIDRYKELPKHAKPEALKYGIDADEAHRFGLPCGGTMELIIEFNPEPQQLAQIVDLTGTGKLVRKKLDLENGQVSLADAGVPEKLMYTPSVMKQVFGPSYRMLIIGAGQLSEYLATMAIFNGFQVSVCDPRSEYNQLWSTEGAPLLTEMPDDAVEAFKPDSRTCIVALTHDPKLDDLALLSALHTNAFYVGAIGSRRNAAARRQRMIEYLDQSDETMDKLRGPVGIFIGSKTPSEIAVSVMAEIIAVKNGISLPKPYDVAHEKNRLGDQA